MGGNGNPSPQPTPQPAPTPTPSYKGASYFLDQGIKPDTLARMIKNGVDLHDVATNAKTLFDAKIRPDLIQNWLDNGTNLKNAVEILNKYPGVDLNLIGTSSDVGNFANL